MGMNSMVDLSSQHILPALVGAFGLAGSLTTTVLDISPTINEQDSQASSIIIGSTAYTDSEEVRKSDYWSYLARHHRVDPLSRFDTSLTPEAILGNWELLARSGLSEVSYHRVYSLAELKEGWRGSGSQPLSAESLKGFLEFWDLVKDGATEPEYTLLPNGALQVEWYKSDDSFLEIEFGSEAVFFGLFDGDHVIEGKDSLINLAGTFRDRESHPLQWEVFD